MVGAPGKTVVLIHGLWVTAASWNTFRQPWEAAGYTVHTPTWSVLVGRSAAELNADPPAGLGSLSVGRIVDDLQVFIEALAPSPDGPPLLVGHSFGGLFVQMLLDRGVGRAGIPQSRADRRDRARLVDPDRRPGTDPALERMEQALCVHATMVGQPLRQRRSARTAGPGL